MPRLILASQKNIATISTGVTLSNVSSSLSGNMDLIQAQINEKTNDYINIKNAVKILETYANWNGYIKLYTEVESNFSVNDIVYITYTESTIDTGITFNLENPSNFDTTPVSNYNFYVGYKVLYVNTYKNEVVINRYFNDITPGTILNNQYLSKVSCRGGNYYNNISDGVVYYNCNVGTFGFLEGHVYSGATTGTTITGATITIGSLVLSCTTDINGYYSFIVPTGTFLVNCSATGYASTGSTIVVTLASTTTLDFHLYKTCLFNGGVITDTICTFNGGVITDTII